MGRRFLNRVGRKGYKLDDQELIRLYIDENLNIQDVANRFNVSYWTILDHLKENNIRKNIRHNIDTTFFKIPNIENSYWAGFMAADGSVGAYSASIELGIKDKKHLEKIAKILKDAHPKLGERIRTPNKIAGNSCECKRSYRLVTYNIYSKELVNDAKDVFSLIPNKSLVLDPPNINNNLARHFIRGYFDGDGSIGWHKHNNSVRLDICSGSEKLLSWIIEHINSNLNIKLNIRKKKRSNAYNIDKVGFGAQDIFNWLYKDSTEQIRLDRKYDLYVKYTDLMLKKQEEHNYIKK